MVKTNEQFKEIDNILKEWESKKIFESNPNNNKKFFLTVPYPYTSGPLHVGHARSYTLGDITARYYRMKGYNVLFPMAFHITGTPILAISKKIENNDEKTIKLHEEYVSFYENDKEKGKKIVQSFKNPENLANYYASVIIHDFKRMGYSIDWRRKFNTGEKFYNKFVEWQFKKMHDKGFIVKGKHAVYFCPSCNNPVTTDDIQGGDELSVEMLEFYLIKEKFEDGYIVVATLRPETLFGVTNVWINKDKDYAKCKVNDEIWYISKKSVEKLKKQLFNVEILENLRGDYFVNKKVFIPLLEKYVKIFHADFVEDDIATGIVNSVPSHAPYDYIAVKEQNLNLEFIRIIEGKLNIEEIMKNIKSQKQTEDLKKATQILYKDEYYNGVMNEKCKEFKGMKVMEAKNKIFEKLKEKNLCEVMYENNIQDLNGEVIKGKCRCGKELEIRILDDQWFLDYGNEEWKDLARECLNNIEIQPEIYSQALKNAIEWLKQWPCTRSRGLGTKFPFDKKWIIESLSDSTIYMSFYTIANLLRELNVDELDEKFFDYVFLGKEFEGCEKYKYIRDTFLYYYPMDERRTGIAHIQNHLSFMIFHHSAIFPKNLWPKKISLNEMLIAEGKKMSKSLGNVIPLKIACDKYSPDIVRLYLAYAADCSSTLDWRENEIKKIELDILSFKNFILQSENNNINVHLDSWIISKFYGNLIIFEELIKKGEIRKAIQKMFFDFLNDLKWYFKRNGSNAEILKKIKKDYVKVMSIFVPFTCEILYKKICENENVIVSVENFPDIKSDLINKKAEILEDMLKNLIDRVREFIKMIEKHKKPNKLYIYFAEEWKRALFLEIKEGKKINEIMKNEIFKKNSKEVLKILNKVYKEQIIFVPTLKEEFEIINSAKEFLERELNLSVEIQKEVTYDPKNTLKFAMPLNPSIYLE